MRVRTPLRHPRLAWIKEDLQLTKSCGPSLHKQYRWCIAFITHPLLPSAQVPVPLLIVEKGVGLEHTCLLQM